MDACWYIEKSYPQKMPKGDDVNKHILNLLIETGAIMPPKFVEDIGDLITKYCNDDNSQLNL